ncbi:aminotransferase class IV [Massilia sp. erpn]|uniref:aminotransferase class IV n=1 Tax=Massilia sp. erpn TaxID=2738142 RepID=UPI0021058E78|nr:aminotransferase class IV [Massilia sp. erpn]UTY60873.1 2-keto-4-methylthiobutyrate aminotransferase [Massilia sp. erpn]
MAVWCEGRIVEQSVVDVSDRGFTLGDGLFETLSVSNGEPCFLDRHLKRLRAGCDFLGIPLLLSDAVLLDAIFQLLHSKALLEAVVRITLTRGPAPRGILPPLNPKPTLIISAEPRSVLGPAEAIVATVTRRNEHSPLSRIKSINYLDNILARREAANKGANEALLMNSAGALAEASTANLFACINGLLCTPPIDNGALPGIMRNLIIEHFRVSERSIGVADLIGADYAFLSNSLGLRVLRSVDGHLLADCSPVLERIACDVGFR